MRLSPDESQPAVEGSLELVDDKGQRAVGWLQYKLHSEFSAKTLAGLRKIKLFHDASYRGTLVCEDENRNYEVQDATFLFCT